jgi:hypothetical protein
MRVTSISYLAAQLRLPPSSLAALRGLSLDEVAKLTELIDAARESHREQMEQSMVDLGGRPMRLGYKLLFVRDRR